MPYGPLVPVLLFGAVVVAAITVVVVIYRRRIRSWWMAAVAAQAACIYMLLRAALAPSEPWVPGAVGTIVSLWQLFLIVVLAPNDEDAPS